MGHLNQQRKNQRSTKVMAPPSKQAHIIQLHSEPTVATTDDDANSFPTKPLTDPTGREHYIYAACRPITGQIYSDLPGRFVVPSTRGNNYLLIVYDYDTNAILAEALKNRTGKAIVDAYETIYKLLVSSGLTPRLQRLDNEASVQLRSFLTEHDVNFQLAPPHVHCRNAAKRAIQTFKHHFISILCGLDPNFPLHLWCRIIPQTLLTLNLLRGSRINPRLSAQAHLHGAFDFNRTPLGPLGRRVLIHETADVRKSYAPHGVNGYYIGAAEHHYRCYRVYYATDTKAERNIDTLSWFPAHIPMPQTSSNDAARAASTTLIEALQNPIPATPFAGINTTSLAALRELSTKPPTTTEPDPLLSLPSIPPSAPRVPPTPTVPPSASPIPPAVSAPRVQPADTYASKTRNPNQHRRQAKQKRTAAQPPTTLPTRQHQHHTDSNTDKKALIQAITCSNYRPTMPTLYLIPSLATISATENYYMVLTPPL
jgi:hypothetical protein